MAKAAFVFGPALAEHELRADHPMRPVRLRYAFELLQAYGAFETPGASLVAPRPATHEELLSFHEPAYIDAVRRYGSGGDTRDAWGYGFADEGDNPIYPGMYEAALLSTGASVVAAQLVADGSVSVAFSPAGGLHHAAAGRASGFCIFNDPVVAINCLRAKGLRVAYVDIDAHHGDGVQTAYYSDPDVLTISLHESGRYLFPGTGDVDEIGLGAGRGYAVNVPLLPYTDDDVYLEAFDAIVPPLIAAFKPDVIATQLGVDTYVTDSLTHVALSTNGIIGTVERFAAMGLPWLAFGGGGYDLDAVARCWTLAYGVMLDHEWPDEIPPSVRPQMSREYLRDGPTDVDDSVRDQTRAFAQRSVELTRQLIFPTHGLAP